MFLAIDIGGTKMAVAVVDEDGSMFLRQTVMTDVTEPWPALEQMIGRLLAAGHELSAVGIGVGGPMSPGGETVSPLNITGWRDFPLKARITALTGLPVFVDNDAKALALGEGWLGAAKGYDDYLAMVVSTGVGGGIVLDGRLLDGATGNAGHIGHIVVVAEGRACACGSRGCLEAEASGTGIAAIIGRPAADADETMRVRTGTLVGRGVAQVCVLLDIKLAVVAGSVALGYGSTFFDAAQRELDRLCRISYAAGAVIRPGGMGADGPLIGAAAVARRAVGFAGPQQPTAQ